MYRIIKNSIKGRMILIISLMFFLVVTGSSFFAYNTSRQILEETLERTAIDAANKNAVILSDKLLKSINAIKNLDITTIKDREHIIDSLDQQTLLKLYWKKAREGLKEFIEDVDYLDTIFVSDTNGNYTDILNEKGNISGQEYFKEVLDSEEILLSRPIRMNKEDVIVILRPIIIKDKIRLILGGTIGLDYLNHISSTMNINGYGYAWVIDNEMNTIVHPNKDYYGNKSILENNQQLLQIAEEMSAGRDGENTFAVNDEIQKITFAPIESTNWSLALTASNDMLLAPLSKVRNSSIIIGFFAIIFGVTLIYFIAVSIAKPIIKLTEVTEKVASGDLTQKINNFSIKNEDEIGRLTNSIKKMLSNLREMIGKTSNISNQVAISSTSLAETGEQVGDIAEQVGSAIQNVAAGAEEQAVQVEKTVANVSNLINRIGEINKGSNTMNEAADNVMGDIKNGNQSINYSVENINNVKTSSSEVSGIINSLGETSTEIDNIVNVINGIANQTNLLALNAAIEAARAGNAGQGFSVVADEIRNLAEESAGATEEIKVLISKIQKNVNNAVVKMDNNNKIVVKSVDAIYETGEIFNKIEHEAVNLIARIGRIVKNTQEMTNDSKKVNKVINDIIVLSKQFARNSEEVAAFSEEQIAATEEIVSRAKNLNDISEELTQSIEQFKL